MIISALKVRDVLVGFLESMYDPMQVSERGQLGSALNGVTAFVVFVD